VGKDKNGIVRSFQRERKPDPDVVPIAQHDLRDKLIGLSLPGAPWHVRDGAPEGVDLIAEFRVDDPLWLEVFRSAGSIRTFKTFMRFDSEKREVRAQDREIQWTSDSSSDFFGPAKTNTSGNLRKTSIVTVDGQKYRFDTNDIKNPIKSTVTAAGWTYRAVVFGKV
jgi:hypothetical protein